MSNRTSGNPTETQRGDRVEDVELARGSDETSVRVPDGSHRKQPRREKHEPAEAAAGSSTDPFMRL